MAADTIRARVARGVALLDEKLPGWAQQIDLDRLDLGNTCNCILGQGFEGHPDVDMKDWVVTSPFDIGVRELFAAAMPDQDHERAARVHGFDAVSEPGYTAQEYAALTTEWKRVILARRGGA